MTDAIFDDEDFGGVGYTPKNEEEISKKVQEEAGQKDFGPRIKIQQGLNRFWVLPSLDSSNGNTIRLAMVHFGPHHMCGRGEWTINEKNEAVKNGKFADCKRCLDAWNLFDENVPKNEDGNREKETPHAKKWGSVRSKGMSSSMGVIQVVNMTPFFKATPDGSMFNPDKKKLKYFDQFVGIIDGSVNVKELDDDFPEDLLEAAQCGVQTITIDEATAKNYVQAYRKQFYKNENAGLPEPSKTPHLTLLEIRRSKDTQSKYTDKSGKTQYRNTHTVTFEDWGGVKAPDFKALYKAIKPQVINIHNPKLNEEEQKLDGAELLQAKAIRLMKLDPDEMQEYLVNCKHKFVEDDDNDKQSDHEEGLDDEPSKPKKKKVEAANDPDAFSADDFLDESELNDIESLKDEIDEELNDD